MLRGAPTGGAKNPGSVGVIDGHYRVVVASDLQDVRQLGDAAFHREHAVRPDDAPPRAPGGFELGSQVVEV